MNRFFGVPLMNVNSANNNEDLKGYLKGIFDLTESRYDQRVNEQKKADGMRNTWGKFK